MFPSLSTPSSLSSSLNTSLISIKPPPTTKSLTLRRSILPIKATSNQNNSRYSLPQKLKHFAKSAILITAAVSITGKISTLPVKATEPPLTTTEQSSTDELSELLDYSQEAVEKLRQHLQQKLQKGEDEETLKLLERLTTAQPDETEWKFIKARLLAEMGRLEKAKEVFEEILQRNPLSFEGLFEYALLMVRLGEGEVVRKRLEEVLVLAEGERKVKEMRDMRFIIAQVQFLEKDVDGALLSYEDLIKEDAEDFRPYFCRGVIYSLLNRNDEAKEQFAKFRELSPKKFDVEGYLRTPLSKMKLFGGDGEEN